MLFFCFKQKTAYEMRMSDWSSDVCSSDLAVCPPPLTEKPIALDAGWTCHRVIAGAAATSRTAVRPIHQCRMCNYPFGASAAISLTAVVAEIGRASCRERVCQYV